MARSSASARLPRRAWFGLIVILTLAPPLVMLLDGRDVDALNFINIVDPDSSAAWAGRLATGALLLLATVVIFLTPQRTISSSGTKTRIRWLVAAVVIFFVGHTLLPAFFGAIPNFDPSDIYAMAIIGAAISARSLPSHVFFTAMKASLLALMIGGFIVALIKPEIAIQYVSADLRLPSVDFRFWGIGSSPNNIAPLALLLLLLTIHTPYKSTVLNLVTIAAGAITLLLAQSQTTWAAALVVLPAFTLYCKTPKPIKKARINPLLAMGALTAVGAGLILIVWEASQLDLSGLFDSSLRLQSGSFISRDEAVLDSFTGRTVIWGIAMDTWRDHPWFGYGHEAWGVEFRNQLGIPFASNAHNQLMQSASVGGSIAVGALILYLATLLCLSKWASRTTNGLSLAVVCIAVIRGFTEGPLDTDTLLSGEVLFHMAAIQILSAGLLQSQSSSKSTSRKTKAKSEPKAPVKWSDKAAIPASSRV